MKHLFCAFQFLLTTDVEQQNGEIQMEILNSPVNESSKYCTIINRQYMHMHEDCGSYHVVYVLVYTATLAATAYCTC